MTIRIGDLLRTYKPVYDSRYWVKIYNYDRGEYEYCGSIKDTPAEYRKQAVSDWRIDKGGKYGEEINISIDYFSKSLLEN